MARLVSTLGSLSFAALASVSLAASPEASAQTVGAKVGTSILPALAGSTTEARNPSARIQRWACADGLEIDVKPLASEGGKASDEWVIIYREKGKAVSSERVSRDQAMRTTTWSCRPATTS